ncbi:MULTISPECIES: pyridoxamine 5'-phosphate oxidase family protein [Clostridia]|uniref:pyridoxamine 5'-phosphate oxidase family protein n=1 Tax=Clostridia TaxID=186801 RepID=UPI000EA1BF44|nr:pyridoxamine 5'-phosphate oxidase family protein [Clostridium sp. 1xD42-85]NBJ70078.1 general stress protein [Roseburia sp. 1XD42-34]RKI77252.1 general stress protein [Clostridium sp. 1xD42-85]
MSQEHLRTQIEQILEDDLVGPMATVKGTMPHSRYMTFYHDGLILYTLTSKQTDKVTDIEQNPYTHIILGYEGEGFGDAFVEYEGKVKVNDSPELKKQLWSDHAKVYFKGPDDPNLTVLEIQPLHVRLMNKKGEDSPQELEL